jgi:hypothetical protein
MSLCKTEIVETIARLDLVLGDYVTCHDLYEALDYDGSIHELIDAAIDHRYFHLRQWAVDNYSYIEDAMDEGLIDTSVPADFHRMIQTGQYVWLQTVAYDLVEAIFAEHIESIGGVAV